MAIGGQELPNGDPDESFVWGVTVLGRKCGRVFRDFFVKLIYKLKRVNLFYFNFRFRNCNFFRQIDVNCIIGDASVYAFTSTDIDRSRRYKLYNDKYHFLSVIYKIYYIHIFLKKLI